MVLASVSIKLVATTKNNRNRTLLCEFPKDNEEAGTGNGSEAFQSQYSFYLSFMWENIAAKSGQMKMTKPNVKRRKPNWNQLITTLCDSQLPHCPGFYEEKQIGRSIK